MASKEELDNQSKNNKLLETYNNLLTKQIQLSEDAVQDQRDLSNILRDQTKDLKFQVQEKQELISIGNSLNKIAQEGYNLENRALGSTKDLIKFSKEQLKVQNNINQLKSLQGVILDKDEVKQQAINDSIKDQIKSAKELGKALKEQEEISKSIASSFGVKSFAGLAGIVKSLPGLGALSTPFEEAAEASRIARADQIIIFENKKKQRVVDKKNLDEGKELSQLAKKRLGIEGQSSKLIYESPGEYQERLK